MAQDNEGENFYYDYSTRVVLRTSWDVVWSPDGSKLAVASNAYNDDDEALDANVQIFDATSHQVHQVMQLGRTPSFALAWRPDGSQLATTDLYGVVRRWDITSGELLGSYPISDYALIEASWSCDGQKLAVAGYENALYILNPDNGHVIGLRRHGRPSAPGLSDAIVWLDWSPDGTKLATGGVDGVVRIWEASTLASVRKISVNSKRFTTGVWSPDSRKIATNNDDGNVQIWDTQTGQKILTTLKGHDRSIDFIVWSPDGIYLASTSDDETLRIWNATTGQQVNKLEVKALQIDWSVTNKLAYTTAIRITDTDPGSQPPFIIDPLQVQL